MKTYKNLYESILDIDLIEECLVTASKGKRKKPPIRRVLHQKERYSKMVLDMLENETYHFKKYQTIMINEGTSKKERTIVTPAFYPDQIIHHLIASQIAPIISKSMYEHAYGSIPGKGIHVAKKRMEKWIRKYGNKRFYVFKCDIRKFYDHIDHDILKRKLQLKINDTRFLKLVFSLIDSFEEEPNVGIPKGFYTSQWFAHLYLTEMDHFIKEELHVKHYMRYLDDMVLIDTNKRRLRKNAESLRVFLKEKLNLELKDDYQLYRFVDANNEHGRDIDFMGFRFWRGKTTLRKRNLKAIRRKANHLDKKRRLYNERKGTGVTSHDAQSMLSYLGWTKHADVYNWYQKEIKPKVSKRRLRKKVSNKQRCENARLKREQLLKESKSS